MKKAAAFLRYVIDPRKLKRLIICALLFALSMLVGCRAQQGKDFTRYEAEKAALLEAHAAELAQVENGHAAELELRAEADEVAKVLYGTARYNSEADQRLVVWCIINRVECSNYPDTVVEVCQQADQWMGYSPDNPVVADLWELANEELARYYTGGHRPLGPEYVFLSWTEDEIVLRDRFEETGRTHYWRA